MCYKMNLDVLRNVFRQVEELRRSLLQIVEVLFNYINYGSLQDDASERGRGQAPVGETGPRRKVDVQSLTHLVETRAWTPFQGF